MKFSQHLAVAGILSIFGYGYAQDIQLLPCMDDNPGYVYILVENITPELAISLGSVWLITGSSGAPPNEKIIGDSHYFSFIEAARYPVNDCGKSLSEVISFVSQFFESNSPWRGQQFPYYVAYQLFSGFSRAIEVSVFKRIMIKIPPTSYTLPAEHFSGYINVLFMSFTQISGPPFVCVVVFQSTDKVPDPAILHSGVTLPFMQLSSANSSFTSFLVNDCSIAYEQVNYVMLMHYPDGYWSDRMLFDQPCKVTFGDEKYQNFFEIVASAIARFEVTQSTVTENVSLIED